MQLTATRLALLKRRLFKAEWTEWTEQVMVIATEQSERRTERRTELSEKRTERSKWRTERIDKKNDAQNTQRKQTRQNKPDRKKDKSKFVRSWLNKQIPANTITTQL